MEKNYNHAPLTEEEYLRRFEEETITIDEDWDNDNIADEIAREKLIKKYIRSFNTYK